MSSKKKATKEKPLEKMTAKELRDAAIETSEITGVHGMNKVELIQPSKKSGVLKMILAKRQIPQSGI